MRDDYGSSYLGKDDYIKVAIVLAIAGFIAMCGV